MNEPAAPQLSVVLAIVSDTTHVHCDGAHLARALEALSQQKDPPTIEVLVPYHAPIANLSELESRYPQVRFLYIEHLKTYTGRGGSREHHDELRAHGLRAARGTFVALLEDHAIPDPQWAAEIVRAFAKNEAGVGGAMDNRVDRPLNWAVFFCDFGKYQNPLPAGPTQFASDANVAYRRAALTEIASIWHESFHEPAVNWHLLQRGHAIVLRPQMVVYQNRIDLRFAAALRERMVWGRSYAAARSKSIGIVQRLIYIALAPLIPVAMVTRMARQVFTKRRHQGHFLRALPLCLLLTAAWAFGEWLGYLTGRTG